MNPLIILGCIAAVLVGLALFLRHSAPELIFYDEDEELPPRPQAWGVDQFVPWPGDMELYDDPEEEIEVITGLWNEAMNDGDTILASALFEDYERLCRVWR